MKLLAFDGALRLQQCCAKPANRVRVASADDIVAWLKSHPEAHELVERALEAARRP